MRRYRCRRQRQDHWRMRLDRSSARSSSAGSRLAGALRTGAEIDRPDGPLAYDCALRAGPDVRAISIAVSVLGVQRQAIGLTTKRRVELPMNRANFFRRAIDRLVPKIMLPV